MLLDRVYADRHTPAPTDCLHSGRVVCQEHTAKIAAFLHLCSSYSLNTERMSAQPDRAFYAYHANRDTWRALARSVHPVGVM